MNKETCLQAVQSAGFKNVKELAEQESRTTDVIWMWHKNNPKLFKAFLVEAKKRKVKK